MKKKIKQIRIKAILSIVALLSLTLAASAVNWYDKMESDLGSVSIPEYASWIIEGRADYITVYLAPKVGKIEKIDNVSCIAEDGVVLKELNKLPVYKKWVVITPDGNVSPETSRLIAQSNAKTVLVLDGGKQAWESKIAAVSMSDSSLNPEEAMKLNHVRPYFHEDAVKITPAIKAPVVPLVRPAAQASAAPVEEEGC